MLRGGGNAVDAVCTATQVLEDSPRTNAGFGSSLTADGTSTFSLFVRSVVLMIYSWKFCLKRLRSKIDHFCLIIISFTYIPMFLFFIRWGRVWCECNGWTHVASWCSGCGTRCQEPHTAGQTDPRCPGTAAPRGPSATQVSISAILKYLCYIQSSFVFDVMCFMCWQSLEVRLY